MGFRESVDLENFQNDQLKKFLTKFYTKAWCAFPSSDRRLAIELGRSVLRRCDCNTHASGEYKHEYLTILTRTSFLRICTGDSSSFKSSHLCATRANTDDVFPTDAGRCFSVMTSYLPMRLRQSSSPFFCSAASLHVTTSTRC